MGKFAEKTEVSVERSRAEIERLLEKYGATGFAYAYQSNRAMIMFEIQDRRIRFWLHLPDLRDFNLTPKQRTLRTPAQAKAAWDQAVRQRWRALTLIIKAKLEAVEADITTLEEEFLAHIVLPDNETIGEWLTPQIEAAYRGGRMPPLLPGPQED